MLQFLGIAVCAAVIFAACRVVDVLFQKRFRSQVQHKSGLSVRASKRYGVFGVALLLVGVLSVANSHFSDMVLLIGGVIVFAMGVCLSGYYLGFGIFYDADTMLVSDFGKRSRVYRFSQIRSQKLYKITGGSTLIELTMDDGKTISVQTTMEGTYPFLDAAFAAWCVQTGRDPDSCEFHDPSKSLWFPHEEDV